MPCLALLHKNSPPYHLPNNRDGGVVMINTDFFSKSLVIDYVKYGSRPETSQAVFSDAAAHLSRLLAAASLSGCLHGITQH